MRILIASEVFPPRAGGAGWSARALALGLREAGHDVRVVSTSPGPGDESGMPVLRLTARGRKRFAVPRAFSAHVERIRADVIHAQHSLSALGCVRGSRAPHTAVTVRDHWPVCFWSTRISRGAVCPSCGLLPMTRCAPGQVGAPAPVAWGALPYMGWDLAVKRRMLSKAGATLAVSEAIAGELKSAGLPRVEAIPNVVDAAEVRAVATPPPSFELPERFLLFVGKLELNKGALSLIPAVARAATGLPLVILGEGTLSHAVKLAATREGIPLAIRGWAAREDVLRTMARATALVFPSLWPEPLSRVLLEALALGAPAAAVDTGGTREILEDGESGLVVPGTVELGDAVRRLVEDATLRDRIREGARSRALRFSPEALVPRYEAVYRRLA